MKPFRLLVSVVTTVLFEWVKILTHSHTEKPMNTKGQRSDLELFMSKVMSHNLLFNNVKI